MSSKRKSSENIDEKTNKTSSKKQRTKDEPSTSTEQNYDSIRLLAEEGFEDVSKILKDNGVTSDALSKVTQSQLEELGIRPQRRRKAVVECIQKIAEKLYGKVEDTPDMNTYETPPNSRHWVSFTDTGEMCAFDPSLPKRLTRRTPIRSSKGRPRRLRFN